MLEIKGNSGNNKDIVIKKDDNKLGKRKRYEVLREFKDILFYHNVDVFIIGYNIYPKNEKIWSVYGIGDINPELNSYLVTFDQAKNIVLDSLNANEFDAFIIFIQGE
jgi:hypothetical protein